MTLRDFLAARYTEDETFFRAAAGDEAHQDWAFNKAGDLNEGALVWAALRILDEIAANRSILAALDMTPCACQRGGRCVVHDSSVGPPRERYLNLTTRAVLRALAGVYAEHEDFQPEWAL